MAEEDRIVEVEIDEGPPCPECGCRRPHFCVGERGGSTTVYVGVRKIRTEDPLADQRSDYGILGR